MPPDLWGHPRVWSKSKAALATVGCSSEDSRSWLLGKASQGGRVQAFTTMITTKWSFEIDVLLQPARAFRCRLSPDANYSFRLCFHDEAALWSFSYYISTLRTCFTPRDFPEVARSCCALASDYLTRTKSYSPYETMSHRANDDLNLDVSDIDSDVSDIDADEIDTDEDVEGGYDWVFADEVTVEM
ncbi:hypothetical protein P692DRAFT_20879417 [Suillus brevipes Sb2]|nr:hypothetical protein P692DRAFT_20879417 [Suillus brevipes Sb2]